MTGPTCGGCRFFHALPNSTSTVLRASDQFVEPLTGECRRRAPVITGQGLYRGLPNAEWPSLSASESCGEHEPRVASVAEGVSAS